MEPANFRIVYCSRNLLDGAGIEPKQEIRHILEKARDSNRRQSVTGALLYNSGYFAQVLEGPQEAIEQIFEKIQRDHRHSDIVVLECSGVEERDFPEWSMAEVFPPTEEQATIASRTLHRVLADQKQEGPKVLELLRSLVIRED